MDGWKKILTKRGGQVQDWHWSMHTRVYGSDFNNLMATEWKSVANLEKKHAFWLQRLQKGTSMYDQNCF
jgi:hypothetical protein